MALTRRQKEEKLLLLREKAIRKARRSFWSFNQLLAPDFYRNDRPHLLELSNTLQALYEGRLVRWEGSNDWQIVESTQGLGQFETCKRLMLNLPPQHGKSRTLINFCEWVFGKKRSEKIITASYNDSVASDFSRYTRDGIAADKTDPLDFVYSDIFPETKIKDGQASHEKWALDGQHFSYLGAGVGGSLTSKGGTILIVDDPIKSAEEALNEGHLDKLWRWYTGTFLSRVSADDGEPIEIVNMTRWAKGDICGRILDGKYAAGWYVLKMEAYNEDTDEMLCPGLLSKARYDLLKDEVPDVIFLGNYHQQPIDLQGRLYKEFKTYTNLPTDKNGNPLFEQIINYTDTADEGADYLCSICAGIYKGEGYVLDVLYTKAGMEETEPAAADLLTKNKVNTAHIESNNGGRGFARAVERLIWERHKTRRTVVRWFHQSKNKRARILSCSNFVQQHIYFPVNWKDRWPEYYKAMVTYQKEGKNKNDDAPDATTGIGELIDKRPILTTAKPAGW